ncbi:MAG: BatD family protein [Odoribacteraceae bacterium]|jgi:hypothetical protein|nr:BatD family protein [Odoribacteraceae bacterium]
MTTRKRVLFIIALLGCTAGTMKAQQAEYSAGVDTSYLLIGDQVRLTLTVKDGAGTKVTFPPLRDTVVRGLEIVAGPERDSMYLKKENRMIARESYVLTAFDTGVYVIPAMPIKIEREGYSTILLTDPIRLIVNTYAVDKEKGIADIVLPKGAPWNFAELLPYLFWGGVALVACAGIVVLITRLRSRKSLSRDERPAIPPYVLAIQALDEIREEKPWQHGKTKEYYTRLTETLRGYMEGELEIPALEQTTSEILLALKEREEVSARDRERLEELLDTADLVKFAKASPLPDEDLRYLDVAYDFVNHANEQVRQREEKEAEARRAREEEEEAKKTGEGI